MSLRTESNDFARKICECVGMLAGLAGLAELVELAVLTLPPSSHLTWAPPHLCAKHSGISIEIEEGIF